MEKKAEAVKKTFNKKRKIKIGFSESDISDLQNGGNFDWTFDDVDVHLFNEDTEPEEMED